MDFAESAEMLLRPLLGSRYEPPVPLERSVHPKEARDIHVYWRVEHLLAESLRLLERCRTYGSEWRRLHERNLLFAAERFRFAKRAELFDSQGVVGRLLLPGAIEPNTGETEGSLEGLRRLVETYLEGLNKSEMETEKYLRALAFPEESPLSSGAQLGQLKNLFMDDLAEAEARLAAAEIGLSQIYGINVEPLPQVRDLDSYYYGAVHELIVWARRATHELLSLIEYEQETHVTISLANESLDSPHGSTEDEKARGPGLIADLKKGATPVHLPFDMMGNHGYVRLRGIGLTVVLKEKKPLTNNPIWRARVYLPEVGLVRQRKRVVRVRQPIDPLELGHITAQETGQIELVKSPSIFNASIFASEEVSKLLIEIVGSTRAPKGDVAKSLSGAVDVLLHLKLASIPAPWEEQ
jgi:hypothetical protein